jgi:hypothetical protein
VFGFLDFVNLILTVFLGWVVLPFVVFLGFSRFSVVSSVRIVRPLRRCPCVHWCSMGLSFVLGDCGFLSCGFAYCGS